MFRPQTSKMVENGDQSCEKKSEISNLDLGILRVFAISYIFVVEKNKQF